MACCCLVANSCLTLCDPWTVARQSSLSMGFSRQESWSGFPFPMTSGQFLSLSLLIGEGNGTPLQYSCLENPMDGGAWTAAVRGVAEGRTGLSDVHFHFSLSCTGEGNGNPLQCSCLENPRDGGAWWAAVYGVAQSRTRLKRCFSRLSWLV